MAAIRIIPASEAAEFPYDMALNWIRSLPGIRLSPKDFAPMLAAGRKFGWTEEMIAENEALAARGRCFDFDEAGEYGLRGTLFEDNIFFQFSSAQHETRCVPIVKQAAADLGCSVFEH